MTFSAKRDANIAFMQDIGKPELLLMENLKKSARGVLRMPQNYILRLITFHKGKAYHVYL